jgi:hypothetical protein
MGSLFETGGFGRDGRDESRYLTAQICLNGHPITSAMEDAPELAAKFCTVCGAATISACLDCNASIRGYYHVPGVISLSDNYAPPNHCHNCGKAFPWTKAKLEAAKEHALEIDGLNDNEKAQLQGAIEDLAAGGARTELGVTRFKKLMKKAGQTVGSGLYKVAIDVASEAAKKLLTG